MVTLLAMGRALGLKLKALALPSALMPKPRPICERDFSSFPSRIFRHFLKGYLHFYRAMHVVQSAVLLS